MPSRALVPNVVKNANLRHQKATFFILTHYFTIYSTSLKLSMGWARLILDLAWTQPSSIGWKAKRSKNCRNLQKLNGPSPKSPKSARIWPNLAKSNQIWSRSHRILSNLSLILLKLAKFIYNIGRVEWLEV